MFVTAVFYRQRKGFRFTNEDLRKAKLMTPGTAMSEGKNLFQSTGFFM